jgi:hypothetical protein
MESVLEVGITVLARVNAPSARTKRIAVAVAALLRRKGAV